MKSYQFVFYTLLLVMVSPVTAEDVEEGIVDTYEACKANCIQEKQSSEESYKDSGIFSRLFFGDSLVDESHRRKVEKAYLACLQECEAKMVTQPQPLPMQSGCQYAPQASVQFEQFKNAIPTRNYECINLDFMLQYQISKTRISRFAQQLQSFPECVGYANSLFGLLKRAEAFESACNNTQITIPGW
jgi:hypothetical protein